MSVASDISTQIGSSWVTPGLVQTFLVLSRPIRLSIKDFLSAQEATLQIQRGKLLTTIKTGDKLAEKMNALSSVVSEVLAPADRLLAAVPLDSIAKESPAIAEVLKNIADSVPIAIPVSLASTLSGLGGFDLFDGVTSYKDLRNRIDDLEFRLTRATALSNYASTGLEYVDNQLDKVRAYIQVIDLLND